MYLAKASEFNVVADMLMNYLTNTDPPLGGGAQKHQARHDGILDGRREGVALGLTSVLNGRRVERFAAMEHVPIMGHYDLMKFMRDLDAKYDELFAELRNKVSNKSDRDAAWDALWAWTEAELNELAFPADLTKAEEDRHRKAVLEGKEQPTEADRPWIEEKLKEAQASMEKIAKLMDPN